MADKKYPTWKEVEKRLGIFWGENYPREKIKKIKQVNAPDGKDLKFGTEKVDTSILMPHVYYYSEVVSSKPDGSENLYSMRIAYFQSGSNWAFHYASPQSSKKTKEGKGSDPLKLSLEKALEINKKAVELAVSKFFPPDNLKDYCKQNGVKLKITGVSIKDKSEAEGSLKLLNIQDPDSTFVGSYLVEGQYTDNSGKFNFKAPVTSSLYMNASKGYWTVCYNKDPVEQANFVDLRRIMDSFFDPRPDLRGWLENFKV